MDTVSPEDHVQDLPKLPRNQKWHHNYGKPENSVAVPRDLTIGDGVKLMIDVSVPDRDGAKPIVFGGEVTIEDGARIDSGARIGSYLTVRRGAIIKTGADLSARCKIGAGTVIGQGAKISANAEIGDGAEIGGGVFIGEGVIVQPGVHVPDHWRINASTSCTVVVNSGRTDGDPPVVLVIPY